MAIKLSKAIVLKAIEQSRSMRDMLAILGLCKTNGNYTTYKAFIVDNNVNTDHWYRRYHKEQKCEISIYKSLQEWLQKNTRISSSKLKEKLLNAKLIEERCVICGALPIWQEQRLVLVLDHINGDSQDNRLENLRLLCPNCNSQQDTFCRQKTKKMPVLWECSVCKKYFPRRALNNDELCVECRRLEFEKKVIAQEKKTFCICGQEKDKRATTCRKCASIGIGLKKRKFTVTKEELEKLVWTMPTSAVSKMFGVSDKAIEKRCKVLGVNKPPRGYWAKQYAQQ